MLQPHKRALLTFSRRSFATATADAPKEEPEKLSNAFKNQHIKYVPRKKYNFNVKTHEGRMALVYQSNDGLHKRINTWKTALASTLPAMGLAHYTLAAN